MAVHFPHRLVLSLSHRWWRSGSGGDVKAMPYNNPINPTHFAASRRLRAQAARRGSRAGYRER